jgi:hypothetical protein
MPSEYEIRAEALRAAVRLHPTLIADDCSVGDVANAYAAWLREGAEQDTAPRVQEAVVNLTAPVDGVQLPGAGAPSACSCEHPASAHTKWDGCRRTECRCTWDPGAPMGCRGCVHPAGWHTQDGCTRPDCLCTWDAGVGASEVHSGVQCINGHSDGWSRDGECTLCTRTRDDS